MFVYSRVEAEWSTATTSALRLLLSYEQTSNDLAQSKTCDPSSEFDIALRYSSHGLLASLSKYIPVCLISYYLLLHPNVAIMLLAMLSSRVHDLPIFIM